MGALFYVTIPVTLILAGLENAPEAVIDLARIERGLPRDGGRADV